MIPPHKAVHIPCLKRFATFCFIALFLFVAGRAQETPVKISEQVALEFRQDSVSASSSYPFFLNPALRDVNDTVQQSEWAALEQFFNEAQQLALEDGVRFPWHLERTVTADYVAEDFVSLSVSEYSYSGGAHPNSFLSSYNFQLTSSETVLLELADLFAPDSAYLELLNTYIVTDLRAQGASDAVNGNLVLTDSQLSAFYANAEGLHFMFSPYAVGAYVEGAFFVTVPYPVLASVIHAQSPLARFGD